MMAPETEKEEDRKKGGAAQVKKEEGGEEKEESDDSDEEEDEEEEKLPLPIELPRVQLRQLPPKTKDNQKVWRFRQVLKYAVGKDGPEEGGRWGSKGLSPGLFEELVAMLDVQWRSYEEGEEEEEEDGEEN